MNNDQSTASFNKRKVQLIQSAGSKCMYCGYPYTGKNPHHFDFHHRDPSEKAFKIYKMTSRSWEEIVAEAMKCDLLCKFCHVDLHCGPAQHWAIAKRVRGERLGATPLGYRTLADGTLTIDHEEQQTVTRARELRAAGLTLRAIGETLATEGHRSKRGGSWGPSTIRLMLAPRYVEKHCVVNNASSKSFNHRTVSQLQAKIDRLRKRESAPPAYPVIQNSLYDLD